MSTEEILRNHRDLCTNPPPNQHTYGAIDEARFKHLVARYLKTAMNFDPADALEVLSHLNKGSGIFIFAANYRGTHHAMRVVGTRGDKLRVLVPAFPYGLLESPTVGDVKSGWKGSFLAVS